jgi:hypothetical protein
MLPTSWASWTQSMTISASMHVARAARLGGVAA